MLMHIESNFITICYMPANHYFWICDILCWLCFTDCLWLRRMLELYVATSSLHEHFNGDCVLRVYHNCSLSPHPLHHHHHVFVSTTEHTRKLATANRSCVSIRGDRNDPVKYSSHSVWSQCKIWLFSYCVLTYKRSSPHVLSYQISSLYVKPFGRRYGSQNWERLGSGPLKWGVADTLETCFSTICSSMPNLVILGHTVRV